MSPALAAVEAWINDFVVAHNLCPFAAKELRANRVRFAETPANDAESLLQALADELALLQADPHIETTVLVHPEVLADFQDYNDFLDLADALVADLDLEGTFQVASFHPDYCFANTHPDAPENRSNRSPLPLLHLLRESSVARAIATHPDIEAIPERNIELLRSLYS